ncbi:hypothetical protein ASE23_14060 [Rhizobium sp. Root73]|nr:hypothetical protein ASC96_20280 [Rhizobium sp. Root1204]KQY02698.1 hypothetical protein ASD36_16260 [Rhizobium sp. Root1334]KRB99305.1 hypothetical protein ASE23_14060 [Rhizobium sp. Root73]
MVKLVGQLRTLLATTGKPPVLLLLALRQEMSASQFEQENLPQSDLLSGPSVTSQQPFKSQ